MKKLRLDGRPNYIGGFSLLEAIVALSIMATSMIALYAWLSTSAIALGRVNANAIMLEDSRTALAFIETINPMSRPRGEQKFEALTIRWDAKPLGERRAGRLPTGSPSAFDLILYDISIEVLRDSKVTGSFQLRRAGWENARPFDPTDF